MFQDDLTIGKRGEKLVAAALLKRGHTITDLSEDPIYQRKDIDMMLCKNDVVVSLEVKNDIKSNTTGNVFVETYNQNNVSRNGEGWFCYCEADYLCFVQELWNEAHIVSRDELIKAIWSGNYRKTRSPFSEGYIVPIGELKKYNTYHCIKLGE